MKACSGINSQPEGLSKERVEKTSKASLSLAQFVQALAIRSLKGMVRGVTGVTGVTVQPPRRQCEADAKRSHRGSGLGPEA